MKESKAQTALNRYIATSNYTPREVLDSIEEMMWFDYQVRRANPEVARIQDSYEAELARKFIQWKKEMEKKD